MKLSKTLLAAAMFFSMMGSANAYNPADSNMSKNNKPCPLMTTGKSGSINDAKVSLSDSTKDQFNRSGSVSRGTVR